ncbi:hypothetical protein MXL46_11405 [Heyndrickxia sporothermodurans]|uniref:hypothetical protein n=1 Tax=Heyndrickxia sporothermodurans TaxID=46224 RepID=UPI002DB60A74|nr:hypothetical protein [Heyndrickxia sporothermodurans]MEB6549693.1 hypothetical protein [Heyndrickxia sporothermodurans]
MRIQIPKVGAKGDVESLVVLGRELPKHGYEYTLGLLTKRSIVINNFMINGKDGSVKWLD